MSEPSTSSEAVPLGFHVIRVVLGAILLAAAGFKAYALWVDPVPLVSVFTSPRWQLALIEVETLLGIWLLSGIGAGTAFLTAQAGFTLLGIVSLFLGILGQPSCGCFGKVTLNPWYTFCLDMAAVAALRYWRPRAIRAHPSQANFRIGVLRPVLYLASGVTFILGLFLATLWLTSPSVSAALTLLRGEPMTIEPSEIEIGRGVRNETREFSLQVSNHSDRTICVLGGRLRLGGCRCVTSEELPLSVAPGETRSLKCKFEFLGKTGWFQNPFRFYTNDESQSQLVCWVAGELNHRARICSDTVRLPLRFVLCCHSVF